MSDMQGRENNHDEAERRAPQGNAGAPSPARVSAQDEELLSAYLDNALDAKERARLERRLSAEAGLAQTLSELRAMRGLLHALPQPALPRSFLLPEDDTEADAASYRQTPALPGRGRLVARPFWAQTVTWAGGLAAILGVALLLGMLVTGGTIRTSSGSASPSSHTHTTNAGSASATQTAQPNSTLQSKTTHTPITAGA
ncbi:MAG TPA: zf-HC2 domain-containing protein, partial [Ktedonobacterales bacterium]|nr:zf-HC2 domain-containing protein [Ktedonobacterales bacterium]